MGEFDIRPVIPLAPAQLERLRTIARTDPAPKDIAAETQEDGGARLGVEPTPVATIDYEGLINTDPRRIASVRRLEQMDDVAALTRYWQISEDPKAVPHCAASSPPGPKSTTPTAKT